MLQGEQRLGPFILLLQSITRLNSPILSLFFALSSVSSSLWQFQKRYLTPRYSVALLCGDDLIRYLKCIHKKWPSVEGEPCYWPSLLQPSVVGRSCSPEDDQRVFHPAVGRSILPLISSTSCLLFFSPFSSLSYSRSISYSSSSSSLSFFFSLLLPSYLPLFLLWTSLTFSVLFLLHPSYFIFFPSLLQPSDAWVNFDTQFRRLFKWYFGETGQSFWWRRGPQSAVSVSNID